MFDVTVFTTQNCMPCKLTKKKLDDFGVYYREESAEMYLPYLRELGYNTAPVVVVKDLGSNTTHSWSGFRLDKLRQLKGLA